MEHVPKAFENVCVCVCVCLFLCLFCVVLWLFKFPGGPDMGGTCVANLPFLHLK